MVEEKKVDKKTTKKSSKEKKPTEVEVLKQQLEEVNGDYLRLRADFENYRKRTEKEIAEVRDKAVINFVEDILPAIDNFEMSLKMTNNQEMFIKGVEMIHKNLLDTLNEHKFNHFEPEIGQEFDAHHHEPVLVEEGESGKVLGVLKKGIKHKETVVRPARVQVKKEE